MEILLNKNKSVNSNNKDSLVGIEIKNTTRPLLFTDFKNTIDAYEVFENERDKSENYRFVITIKPYCTNVLFNPFTEIIKNEGSVSPIIVEDKGENEKYTADYLKINNKSDLFGRKDNIDRQYMIQNTEFSKEKFGFVYKPGYDFFNNHILRNKSFKLVCNYKTNEDKTDKGKDVFNTIGDKMRYANGETVHFQNRFTPDDNLSKTYIKHLYDKDDILNFANGDAINEVISEENGWFGFKNNSSIMSKKNNDFMYINNAINNKKSCEFIDMYPDRSLFSFKPLVNTFKRRIEHNWDIVLTYPFKKYINHDLVRDGKLLLYSFKIINGSSGEILFLFRSFIKHNLKQGDSIKFYVDNKETEVFKISNVGDLKQNNKDYYFYINNINLSKIFTEELKKSSKEIRFVKFNNGIESEYYFRIFKKIPNLKYRKANLTEDDVCDSIKFKNYIQNNACDNENKMYDFTKEVYPLSFSNTIYNDTVVQYIFTDDINIEYLKDHLGRPLTELFITIIKRNRGYEKWYYKGSTERGDDEVEYSHCFGKVTSGIPFLHEKTENDKDTMGRLSDAYLLNNQSDNELNLFSSKALEENITSDGFKSDLNYTDGVIHNGLFFGDIVEFNPSQFQETVLETVYHRFNTVQREYEAYFTNNEFIYKNFQYDDIETDDYDKDGFNIITEELNLNANAYQVGEATVSSLIRPEGYMYKSHYRCQIKEFGSLQQDSHYEIPLKEIANIDSNKKFLLKSKLKHNLLVGDFVYLCNDILNSSNVLCIVTQINNKLECIIETYDKKPVASLKDIKVRKKNYNIPDYAYDAGFNRYLWRNVQKIGNVNNEELIEYPFTNNAFYVNKEINFYLKRQDKDKVTGLYVATSFPQDAPGNVEIESNYNYKEDKEIIC